MATRRGARGEQQRRVDANIANPFVHIPFSGPDLASAMRAGGGPKELVPVDLQYRRSLARSLDAAQLELAADLARYPYSLGPLVLKLRPTGIAKSHRPIKLVEEAQVQPAGHANIDEMLIGAQAASILVLRALILERNTATIRANLSAVERIEPWTQARRNPAGIDALRQRGSALIVPFRYFQQDATEENREALVELLEELQIEFTEIPRRRGNYLFRLKNLDTVSNQELEQILSFPGIRHAYPEPKYANDVIVQSAALPHGLGHGHLPAPIAGLPTVGIFDTGVSTRAASLTPWVRGRERFVLPPETNYEHGTMVASLVAGAYNLNGEHEWLPSAGCFVFDACGLESGGGDVSTLIERLRQTVRDHREIKVWNLSLGAQQCDPESFSEFAQELDALSDEFGVLFVVAAGNYLGLPRRGWPDTTALEDRVSSPGEAIRALTVGSIVHSDGPQSIVQAGSPAPYSRRGPGPVFTPKPDIVHVGGGVHEPWSTGPTSINVVDPNDRVVSSFGTSFSAPIAASMAAHVWNALDGRRGLPPHPALVKALLIHAAQLSSPEYSPNDKRYYGVGRPYDALRTLYDSDDSFTLVFETMVFPSARWRKAPYPIPASLIQNGKLRAEVIITSVYAPPVDPNAGSEYVRANVEISFGVLNGDKITGKVPMESDEGQTGYETLQIEHGAKWSPVKVHRKKFMQGTAGRIWALQAGVTLRAFEPTLPSALPVTIIVTLRAVDGNNEVHADGIRALAATNWVSETLPVRVPVRVAGT